MAKTLSKSAYDKWKEKYGVSGTPQTTNNSDKGKQSNSAPSYRTTSKGNTNTKSAYDKWREKYGLSGKATQKTSTEGEKSYSSTVKQLQDKGIKGASGIMTESEWRRRNKNGGTYQDYLNSTVGKFEDGSTAPQVATPTKKSTGKKMLDSVGYAGEKLGRGIIDGLEGVTDFAWSVPLALGWGVTSGFGLFENSASKKINEWYNQVNQNDITDAFGSAEERYDAAPEWTKDWGWLPETIGNIVPFVAETMLTGGASATDDLVLTGKSMWDAGKKLLANPDVHFGMSAAGGATEEAVEKGANPLTATTYGTAAGALEVATEKLFGGYAGTGVGRTSSTVIKETTDATNKTLLKKIWNSPVTRKIFDIASEGIEEDIVAFGDPILQRATGVDTNAEWASWSDYVESGTHGVILSVVMNAVGFPISRYGKSKAISRLNESSETLNGLIQDDTLKLQPLPSNATEEEIVARQKEVSAVALAFDNAVKKATQNEQQTLSEQPIEDSDTLEKAEMDVVASRNATQSKQQVTVADVKNATGFGDSGSVLIAKLVNVDGYTYNQAKSTVETAYRAGLTGLDNNKATFVTDTQKLAFEAGMDDRQAQNIVKQTQTKTASVYDTGFTEKGNRVNNFLKDGVDESPEIKSEYLDVIEAVQKGEKNIPRQSSEPEVEKYDIPEGSEIVNNIVVDEHSKRLKRDNPQAYSNIIRMAKRLRINVRFVKDLGDENGKVLEGLITSKGIFINADAKNPSRFVATHEFGHRMKQAAPKVWAAYQEYVINKLKRENFGNGMTAYDVLYEETKNAYGKDDADSVSEEIAVNYAGELFDSEEMLENFIREDKSLALRVRDWWYKVLESMGLLSEKKKAQQLWLKAYTAAAKNVKEGKVGEFSGEKFKYVGKTKNGIKKYVSDFPKGMSLETKQELFKRRIATIFNLGAVELKTDVKKIQVLGDRFTAQKNLYGDDSSPEVLEAKINSLYDIAEILSDATFIGKGIEPSYADVNVKPENLAHKDVKYWYYFKNTVEMDGSVYDIVFNIRDKGKEQYQYLVKFTEKNKRTTRISHTVQKTSDVNIDELSSEDNIPQNVSIVNSNSMRNLKKNIKKEQLDIINQNNPAPNSYLTWVRTEDDIKTFSEALDDSDYRDYEKFTPDYTREMAEQALTTGKITMYSSYPIIQGTFVTPSKMEAESYSGTGKVYEKIVDIKDVAWIDPTQGLYARVEEGKKSIPGTRLSELVEKYGAISSGENPSREVQVPQKTSENKKVSQTVRTILEAKVTPDSAIPTIEKMVEDGVFSYDVYTDKQAIKDAENYLNNGNGWLESYTDWTKDVEKGVVSKQHTVLGWALYNNAVNRADTATTETEIKEAMEVALNVLDAMVRHQRNAAQALQATRVLKNLSPESQLYGIKKSVSTLQKELTEKYKDKAPELKIDEELAEQFLSAETEEERLEIEKEIYRGIGRQMPSRFIDKWNAWRYLAMLGNMRTHGRNILGNFFFAPVVVAKDLTATAIESVVYRVSGKKMIRGKSIIRGSKADRELLKAAWSDYGNAADLISNGGKYNDSAMANKHIEDGRQIFKFKPLEWARKKNSEALETEDKWFAQPHYAFALAQYCKANNITAEQIKSGRAIAPAREYAIKEAQKATYRDTNAFSQFVSELGRSGNKKNPVIKGASIVLEGILPFRKTPANILVRGIEYSPIGLLKGLSYDLVQVSKGNMTASEAIDNISAGLTGTGLLALGVLLAAQGIIRGHGEDEEEKEYNELMGHQAYALELPNGQSITLDWLAPEALPFFVGVNIWETTSGTDEELNLSSILQAISRITEPMLEMSCLQSLNDVLEGIGYASSNDTSALVTILSSAATSYLTQGSPTLLGQAERTGEENRMTTYTGKNNFLTSDIQYTLGKASAKIPFWDYNQIPYIDAWGRKEASGVALARGLNNFLNPAYTSTIETSKMEEELLRLYEKTGEGGVFPSRADKYFTVDGKRKDLTKEEYVRYATLKGEKSYKLVSDLVKSSAYKKLSDVDKAKAVKEAYDYANQKAKQAISNYKPDTWVSKADEFGSNVGNYISFKTEISGTKEENGGKISKQEVVDIIQNTAQNGSETWKMYLSMYDTEKDMYAYNKGIQGEDYMNFLVSLDKYDKPTKSGKYGSYTQEEAYRAINSLKGLSRKEKATLWQSVNSSWKAKNNPFR